MYVILKMSLSPSVLPGIFFIKQLNWILKTADLTESSGRLDERPVKNGGDRQEWTHKPDRKVDGQTEWERKTRENGKCTRQTDRQTAIPAMHCPGLSDRYVHPCIWTFHLQVTIQVYLQCIHPFSNCKMRGKWHDYNHTTIVCNKQESRCSCGGGIQVLVHYKVKRIPE